MAVEEPDKPAAMLRAAARLAPHRRPGLPALLGLTDPGRLADPATALAALPRGTGLIWRAYGRADVEDAIGKLARKARAKGIVLLVAGDARTASRPGAAGLHFPERALAGMRGGEYAPARRPRPGLIMTAAAHSEIAIIRAARAGIDAVLISPVFPTTSHAGAPTLGIIRFAQLARIAVAHGLAIYALGGVTKATSIRRLNQTDVTGVAGITFAQ